MGEGHNQVRGGAGGTHNGRRHRARPRPPGAHVRTEPAILREVRLFRPSRDPGVAIRRERTVSDPNQRNADDDLRGLDALMLVHHVHGEPGYISASRIHVQRTARGYTDCRASPR